MTWVRIDDRAMTHPKLIGLSDKAFRLWVWGLCYSQQHLTDGLLSTAAIPSRLKRAVAYLLENGLWESHDVGFKIHDFLDWNDSREVVQAKRAGARSRLQQHRYKRVSDHPLQRVSPSTSETPLARSGVVLGSFGEESEDALIMRAGRLREELYPRWYATYRQGARLRLVANTLEFQEALSLVQTWDDARLEKLARIVLTTDDPFIAGTDRGFRIFALKASWADDRLRQAESGAA